MNVGILLYYITVAIALYCIYLLNFRCYDKYDNRRKTSLAILCGALIFAFFPVFNLIFIISHVYEMRKYKIKSLFLKKW